MQKRALFFFLYFFEGAPIGFIWWTIPTLLSQAQTPLNKITTLLSLATLPWTLKFLLGPLVDRFLTSNKDFSATIAGLQMGMLLVLLWIAISGIDSPIITLMVLCLSICSASQDVVIDAWAIATVHDSERGQVNGAMQAGMLCGRWMFGPGLLIAMKILNWQYAVYLLCLLVVANVCSLLLCYFKNTNAVTSDIKSLNYKSLKFVFEKRFLVLGLIALVSALGLKSMTAVTSPMLVSLGLNETQVGWSLSATLLLMMIGSVLGGRLADRFSAKHIFLLSGILLIPLAVFLALSHDLHHTSFVLSLSAIIYFLVGAFTASSYSFYMSESYGGMEATKFTFLMAITNLCESSAAYVTGELTVKTGSYLPAFTACAILSIFGLWMLYTIKPIKRK